MLHVIRIRRFFANSIIAVLTNVHCINSMNGGVVGHIFFGARVFPAALQGRDYDAD